ncbi:MAG: hypothetical protein KDA41_21050, partial [Planctomycetales bacterium]|nr:hypothetical protein [Planctomycetales bacterium]
PIPAGREPPPRDAIDNLESGGNSFGRTDLNDALLNKNQGGGAGQNGGASDNKPPRGGGGNSPQTGTGGNNNGGGSGSGGDDPPALGVKNAPVVAKADLGLRISESKDSIHLIAEAADGTLAAADRLAKAGEFSELMARLAFATTFCDQRSVGHEEFLSPMLQTAGADKDQRRMIGTFASRRLDSQTRESEGILLAGVVQEVRKQGQLFETVVQLDERNSRPVSVYGAKDPKAALDKGDYVLVLGAIVSKPNQDITGYKGPDEPVVWGGYSQVIPIAAPEDDAPDAP